MRPLALLLLPLGGCLFDADAYRARVRELRDRPGPPEPTTPTEPTPTEPTPTEPTAPCETVAGFVDADGDGFGGDPTTWCLGNPPGVLVGGDCDDRDPDVGDQTFVDADGDGFAGRYSPGCDGAPVAVDCGEGDPEVYPGAPDYADDGIDQDCVGGDEACGIRRVGPGGNLAAVATTACPDDEIRVDGSVPFTQPLDLTRVARLRLVPEDPADPVELRATVSLDDDVLEGFALTGSSESAGGCAVVSAGSGVVLRDVSFTRCSAPEAGGLAAAGSEGLRLERVTFRECSAETVGGAARFTSISGLVLEDVEVRSGSARFVGGVTLDGCDDPVLRRVTFADNTGGALDVDDGVGELLVTASSFVGNTASAPPDATSGAAVQVDAGALDVRITETAFRANTTSLHGGAIAILDAGDVTLTADTFEDDAAGAGVGFVGGSVSVTSAGDVVVEGSDFLRSTAFAGGALAVTASGSLAIDATTFREAGVYLDAVDTRVVGSTFTDPPFAAIETGADPTDLTVTGSAFVGGAEGLLLGLGGEVAVSATTFDDVSLGVVGGDARDPITLTDLAFTGGAQPIALNTAGPVSLARIRVTGSDAELPAVRVWADDVTIDDLVFVDVVGTPVLDVLGDTVDIARLRVPPVPTVATSLVQIDALAPRLAWSTVVNPLGPAVTWISPGSYATMALDHVVVVGRDTASSALVVSGGGVVTDVGSVSTGVVQGGAVVINLAPILFDADDRLLAGSPGVDMGPAGCFDLDGSPCDAGYWGGPDAPP